MNQSDVNRAVAQATGETVKTIRRIGFQIEQAEDEPASQPIDVAVQNTGCVEPVLQAG